MSKYCNPAVSFSTAGRSSCTTPDELFDALRNAKFDQAFWRELSATDCLRYDYKSFHPAGQSGGEADRSIDPCIRMLLLLSSLLLRSEGRIASSTLEEEGFWARAQTQRRGRYSDKFVSFVGKTRQYVRGCFGREQRKKIPRLFLLFASLLFSSPQGATAAATAGPVVKGTPSRVC